MGTDVLRGPKVSGQAMVRVRVNVSGELYQKFRPPVLRALLLAAGDDKEVRAQISRAYYGQMEGAQFSPFVLNGILLSAICAALKDSSAINRNGNGSHP